MKPCLQSQQPTPRHFSGTARLHLNHPGFPFPSLKQTHLIHLNHPPPPSPHSEMDKSSQPHLGGGKGKSAPWSKPTNFWHQLSWQHFRLLPNSQQNSEKWHKFDFREPFIINLLNWAPASVGLYKFYRTISTLLPLEWIRYTKSNFFNFHSAQHQHHTSHIGSLFNATQEIACYPILLKNRINLEKTEKAEIPARSSQFVEKQGEQSAGRTISPKGPMVWNRGIREVVSVNSILSSLGSVFPSIPLYRSVDSILSFF